MCVAHCLAEHGSLYPEDLARRLVDWLPKGRGKGRTCVKAVRNLIDGKPWYAAGIESAGNGAAMRAAPIGIVHALRFDALRFDAALSAVVTHADPMAAASATALSYAVSYLLHTPPGMLDPDAFLASLSTAINDLPDPGHPERRPDSDGTPVRLVDRIGELGMLIGQSPSEVFGYLYNGAFVLESLPAAVWCFLEYREHPELAMISAVNAGYDADTVGSMTGNLVGAYLGEDAIPLRLREDLEYSEELGELADSLVRLSGLLGHTEV
jgi:ADP-ribosylglycohydrolase